MANDVPLQHGLSLTANVVGGTPVAGTNELECVVVNAVARAFAPEEIPIARERNSAGQLQFDSGMNVNDAGRTDEARFTEICALRKQGVEGIEIRVIGVLVSTRDVGLQEKARAQRGIGEYVTCF